MLGLSGLGGLLEGMDYKKGGLLEGMDYKKGGLLEGMDYKKGGLLERDLFIFFFLFSAYILGAPFLNPVQETYNQVGMA